MSTRRPLMTTAIAAGIGTVATLALGPMASAATTQASHREAVKPAAQTAAPQLADTGVDTTPYTVGGIGFLVVGVGMVFASRRFGGADGRFAG